MIKISSLEHKPDDLFQNIDITKKKRYNNF